MCLTLQREDYIRQNFFDPAFAPKDHSDASLFGKEFVRFSPLSKPFKEYWEIVFIGKVLWILPPFDRPDCTVETDTQRKVSSVVVLLKNRALFRPKK